MARQSTLQQSVVDALTITAEAALSGGGLITAAECASAMMAIDARSKAAAEVLKITDLVPDDSTMSSLIGEDSFTDSENLTLLRRLGSGTTRVAYLVLRPSEPVPAVRSLLDVRGIDETKWSTVLADWNLLARSQRHRSLVEIFAAGTIQGVPYLVTEFVHGQKLSDGIPVAWGLDHLIRSAMDVCDALTYLHHIDLVHGNISLSNIWVTSDGTSKLGDSGTWIATKASRASNGNFTGIGAYLAPEVARGEPRSVQSDLYALGILMGIILCGGREPETGEQSSPRSGNELERPPGVSGAKLELIVIRLIAKDPKERYQSAEIVKSELKACFTGYRYPLQKTIMQFNKIRRLIRRQK